ncbi:MAG TPA: GAF domain-containing protein, partial [Thermoanaerobaculia bacterium]|nr:GAF domain-containing protein [Thermoanaerobaculia bacterium]
MTHVPSSPQSAVPGIPKGLPDREFLALEHEVLLLATELATLGDFPRTARLAVESLRDLLGARRVSLVGFDRRAQEPVLAATTAHGGNGADAPAALRTLSAVFAARREVRRAHRAADLRKRSPAAAACLVSLDADWILPLVRRDELMGLLVVGRKADGGEYAPAELDLLHLLSFQLALLLESAELLKVATYEGLTGALRRQPIL